MSPSALPEQFNAADYFVDRHVREGRGSRTAFEYGETSVTYALLQENVHRAGKAFGDALGVRMEERVLLLMQDTPDFAYCFFGAIKIGAVPIPVNTLLKPADYEYLLNDSRARVAVISEACLGSVEQISRDRLPFLKHVIVAGASRPGLDSLHDLMQAHGELLGSAPTRPDDTAFWLYSSGSTGFPKGCVHLQRGMVVASELYARGILDIRESDRFFSVAKLFFAYGLGNSLYFPLAVGATSILLPDPPTPKNVFAVVERYRPTLLFSVPSNYAALLDLKREGLDFDLSSVRAAVSAGEALPGSLYERFRRRFGVEIFDGLGSTEALHIFVSNRPGAVRPGSSGQPVPGSEVALLDDAGNPVPRGDVGTLWVRNDALFAGYWNQHAKTKATIKGEWICTGDKFCEDEDGYFWYAGRSDDMLKVSGVWVSPAEIEAALVEHEAVVEVAVVGVPDKDTLMKPVAWVVLAQDFVSSPELERELQQFVVARLPVYKRPRAIQFVESLPKTATGKIQRFKLREAKDSIDRTE